MLINIVVSLSLSPLDGFMGLAGVLRIPELLMQLGYHQLLSSSMAQLVCCLTHVLRGPGSIPSHGSSLFAFISLCYYMIYFIYGCDKLG